MRAARTGEYVDAGQPIVTLINPDDLWVRADVEETYIDRVRVGDTMTVRLPSGAERQGTVFFRGIDAAFATQRDVSRTKRDIKTFEIRLRVDNTRSPARRRHDRVRPAAAPVAAMNAIDVRAIVKKFGDFTAVNGISFAVEKGEIFGLLGPNGAGKSTLIRMLTTLLPPTGGTALVNGFDVTTQADGVRRSIGVIPQAMTSDLELSVEENLIIFAKLYGVPRTRRRQLIDELLEAVQLTEWRHAPVKNLSGGMRRRVEIARGLVHEPRIFFLDEPTTGLDPVSRAAVWEMLRKVKSERDLTVLLTTHYMDEADKLCDRIAIVDHGELKALDSPLRLKASIPGNNTLDVSFSARAAGLDGDARASCPASTPCPARTSCSASAPATARRRRWPDGSGGAGAGGRGSRCRSRAPRLDDVFVHYTGRGLRDALQEAAPKDSAFMLRRG